MDDSRRRPSEPIDVWVVEDDADYRSMLAASIETEPDLSCSGTFETGEALLEQLNTHFAPDVVLMDIELPGIDGIETARQLRRRNPGSRIVMLTIHEDNDRIFEALCHGASAYLAKGAPTDEVIQAVRDVLAGGAAMTPAVARRVINMFAQLNQPRFDYGLTDRERDVLRELTKGKSKKRIAADLFLSVHTVDGHLRCVYQKLHVSSGIQAVGKALNERIVSPHQE